VADEETATVRRVDTAGIVTTVVGNRRRGRPLEGAEATQTPLSPVRSLSRTATGRVLLGSEDGAVRSLDLDGRIRTLVAPSARPAPVFDALELADGRIAVADAAGVRMVRPDGSAERLLRTRPLAPAMPEPALYQDGLPASRAVLGRVGALAEDPLGGLLAAVDDVLALVPPETGTGRQAIAIAPATLREALRGRAVLETTLGGTAQLRLLRAGREQAASTVELPPGRSTVPLPGRLTSRVHVLAVTIEAHDGRAAADALRVLTGPTLAETDARRTLQWQLALDNGSPGVAFQPRSCTRGGPRDLRCTYRAYDAEGGSPSDATELDRRTVRLTVGADGRPRVRGLEAGRDARASSRTGSAVSPMLPLGRRPSDRCLQAAGGVSRQPLHRTPTRVA
jgi:hypothetical protein